MARKFPCPSCGGEIVFKTSIAAYAVCPFCKTMVVQNNDALENIGVMAALPDDLSPFEIGTEGYFGRDHFGLVGRMKIGWKDGVWNEWFFVSDSGRKGWLAEAQGSYAACYDVSDALDDADMAALKAAFGDVGGIEARKSLLHRRFRIKSGTFAVMDIKEAECLGAEGELPLSAPVGRKSVCIDLADEDGGFASIDVHKGQMRVYVGAYIDWRSLKCSRYRSFEEW